MLLRDASSRRRTLRLPLLFGAVVGLALAALGLATGGLPASAHTSFGSSNPADGAVVAEPVNEIVIAFTNAAEEANDGFVVLDSTGQVREPTSVTTEDGKSFRLAFDPALSEGRVAVRWSVRAGDAHPISGSFSFTVGDASTSSSTDDMAAMSPEEMAAMNTTGTDDLSGMSAAEMAAMDDFMQVDEAAPGESLARLGRIVGLPAIVLAIGVLVFGATTLYGTRREIGGLVRAVRIAGGALAVGAAIEYVGVSRMADDALSAGWSSSAGLAASMRIVGGVAIAAGLATATTLIPARRPARPLSSAANTSLTRSTDLDFWGDDELVAPAEDRTRDVGAHGNGGFFDPGLALAKRATDDTARARAAGNVSRTVRHEAQPQVSVRRSDGPVAIARHTGFETASEFDIDDNDLLRWQPDRRSWLAFVGVGVAVMSFWFDGHTVTKGFRPLHAVANSVHVVAGSVWVGGVVAMAVVMWSRYRRRRPTDALGLVVRFSSVASVALAAVVVAGVVMAIAVLDSPGELTSTPWGQMLLLKTAAATIAIAAGAYNHFRLIPALEQRPEDVALHDHARSTVTAEAIILGFVVVVTAWLVAAAS